MNSPTFATLKRLLLRLGFEDRSKAGSHVLFEYPDADVFFLFRPYRDKEIVQPRHLAEVRGMLDDRGILSREKFEEELRSHSLAG
jgi:hypothetical protein